MSGDRNSLQWFKGATLRSLRVRVAGQPVAITTFGCDGAVTTNHDIGDIVNIPAGVGFEVEGPRGWTLTQVQVQP